MINLLRTIKGKSQEELDQVINELAKSNSFLGPEIRRFLDNEIVSDIFILNNSVQDETFTKIAILSIILADIASIPAMQLREPYLNKIMEICNRHNIQYFDIKVLSSFVPQFEEMLSQKEG